MKLTHTQKLTLYSLGECYRQLHLRFESKPLDVFISKAAFIDFLLKSGLAGKKERALYKNLEELEKKKLITYADKHLLFTPRGSIKFDDIKKEIKPFLCLHDSKISVNFNKKVQSQINI